MERQVFDVVGEGVKSPQMVIDPEAGACQRIILLKRSSLEPHLFQSRKIPHEGENSGGPGVIVPDEPARQSREVGENSQQHNHPRSGEVGVDTVALLPHRCHQLLRCANFRS